MAAIPNNIKLLLDKYLLLLDKSNVKLRNAYLFGSYASGKFNEFSDIDIAIVSDTFEGIRIKDKDKIRRLTLSISSKLEVLPFSPSDFSKSNPLAKEIMETGIRLV